MIHYDTEESSLFQSFADLGLALAVIMVIVMVSALSMVKPQNSTSVEIDAEELEQLLLEQAEVESILIGKQQNQLNNARYNKQDMTSGTSDLRTKRKIKVAKRQGKYTRLVLHAKNRNGYEYISLNNKKRSLYQVVEIVKNLINDQQHYVQLLVKEQTNITVGFEEQIEMNLRNLLHDYYEDWKREIIE